MEPKHLFLKKFNIHCIEMSRMFIWSECLLLRHSSSCFTYHCIWWVLHLGIHWYLRNILSLVFSLSSYSVLPMSVETNPFTACAACRTFKKRACRHPTAKTRHNFPSNRVAQRTHKKIKSALAFCWILGDPIWTTIMYSEQLCMSFQIV